MKADVQAALQRQTSKGDQEPEFLNVISKFFPVQHKNKHPKILTQTNKHYKGKKLCMNI